YHSHLGTRRAGMTVHGENGFNRAIHNIENSPFRTKFEHDIEEFEGNLGIGCISDNEAQPLLVNSHLGSFAITTVGRINNLEALKALCFNKGTSHFLEMSSGEINPTELVAALINHKQSIVEGLSYVQDMVEGSMSVLIMTKEGIYAARDRLGRTPVILGHKEDGYCITFESSAFLNLGYRHYRDLGPGEIDFVTPEWVEVVKQPGEEMKICSFLWVYYGYPTSTYEGINVECMRNRCGDLLAKHDMRDDLHIDSVAGVPDSGTAHAVGYSNCSKIPFARPFIKYTPTWPRSFMPTSQKQRNMIAKMKLIPVQELIEDKSLLLIDDSIVRGTQLGETTQFLYDSGAKEVHVRPACPPIMFGCKYLNFSRSSSEMDLITRRVIADLEEGNEITQEILEEYADPNSERYANMCEEIRRRSNFTTLRFHRLDDMVESIGLPKCKLCTYCFDGKEK
ncbi:MAG: amidophosphoribosyltransferase, partial [Merdibacter sp.]